MDNEDHPKDLLNQNVQDIREEARNWPPTDAWQNYLNEQKELLEAENNNNEQTLADISKNLKQSWTFLRNNTYPAEEILTKVLLLDYFKLDDASCLEMDDKQLKLLSSLMFNCLRQIYICLVVT